MRVRHERKVPSVLVRLGELKALIYRSDRAQRGRPQTFIHFLERQPTLASNPEGTQLYILGGRYHVTRKGIEG